MARFSGLMFGCILAISLISARTVRADDTLVDNPGYLSWVKYKPGTLVKLSISNNAGGNDSHVETQQTLKAIDPDKVTIEEKITITIAGNKSEMPLVSRDIPAKIKKVDPAAPGAADAPKTDTSTEDVQAAGTTYSCTKKTSTVNANGQTVKITTWSCDDVPGTVVKLHSESTGAMSIVSDIVLTDFEPK